MVRVKPYPSAENIVKRNSIQGYNSNQYTVIRSKLKGRGVGEGSTVTVFTLHSKLVAAAAASCVLDMKVVQLIDCSTHMGSIER